MLGGAEELGHLNVSVHLHVASIEETVNNVIPTVIGLNAKIKIVCRYAKN